MLIGHFPRGVDLPAVIQGASPPPVWSPTSSSLQAVLAAKARGGGMRASMGIHKIPRDGRGGGRGSGRETRDRGGAKSGKAGSVKGKTEVIETTEISTT